VAAGSVSDVMKDLAREPDPSVAPPLCSANPVFPGNEVHDAMPSSAAGEVLVSSRREIFYV
jgi:hypothetical protein